jgi:predicted transcriptional regulator
MSETHSQYTTDPGARQAPDWEALAAAAIVTPPGNNGRGLEVDKPMRKQFTLLHADALDLLPPVSWLIPGEIPEGAFTVAYGPTSAGKSFVCLDYALRLAQSMPVVYVAAEGAAGYAARKLVWCEHHKQGAGRLYFIGEAVNMLDPREVDAFTAAIIAIAPRLIVIDTLARCMIGGDENSAQDMGLFVAACDRVRAATGATVLAVHHTGKSGASERGSSALRAACDHMIGITNDDGLLTVTCEKSKDAAPEAPRALRLLILETGRLKGDGSPETSCVPIPAEMVIMAGTITPKGRKVLDALNMAIFREAGASAPQIMDAAGLGSSTVYTVLSRLKADGYIRQHEKGHPYYITEQGIAAISPISPIDSKVEK